MNFTTVHSYQPFFKINHKTVGFKNLTFPSIPAFFPQSRMNSRHKFTRSERFCHIIICTAVQSIDNILFLISCRNHNHRHIGFSPNRKQHVHSVHIRKPQIQQNKVRIICRKKRKSRFPVFRRSAFTDFMESVTSCFVSSKSKPVTTRFSFF